MPSANEHILSLPLSQAFMQYANTSETETNRGADCDGMMTTMVMEAAGTVHNMNATLFPHIYVFTSEHKTHLIWQTTTVSGRSRKHPVPLVVRRHLCMQHRQRCATNGKAKILLCDKIAIVSETNRALSAIGAVAAISAGWTKAVRRRWKTELK